MPRRKHQYSQEVADKVKSYSAVGMPQEDLASLLGISVDTLSKYYDADYKQGVSQANAKIAGRLFKKGMDGDTTAMIFWLKTRARWSEKNTLELMGKDGEPLNVHIFRLPDNGRDKKD